MKQFISRTLLAILGLMLASCQSNISTKEITVEHSNTRYTTERLSFLPPAGVKWKFSTDQNGDIRLIGVLSQFVIFQIKIAPFYPDIAPQMYSTRTKYYLHNMKKLSDSDTVNREAEYQTINGINCFYRHGIAKKVNTIDSLEYICQDPKDPLHEPLIVVDATRINFSNQKGADLKHIITSLIHSLEILPYDKAHSKEYRIWKEKIAKNRNYKAYSGL